MNIKSVHIKFGKEPDHEEWKQCRIISVNKVDDGIYIQYLPDVSPDKNSIEKEPAE